MHKVRKVWVSQATMKLLHKPCSYSLKHWESCKDHTKITTCNTERGEKEPKGKSRTPAEISTTC